MSDAGITPLRKIEPHFSESGLVAMAARPPGAVDIVGVTASES